MEEFVAVTMSADEYATICKAARRRRMTPQVFVLCAALEAARKATREKAPADPVMVERMNRFMTAYTEGLGYAPAKDQMGRTFAAAKQLAEGDADPSLLSKVMAWVKTTDGRYKNGQYLPLQMVAQAWPAYVAQMPVKAAGSHTDALNGAGSVITPPTRIKSDLGLFGDDGDDLF